MNYILKHLRKSAALLIAVVLLTSSVCAAESACAQTAAAAETGIQPAKELDWQLVLVNPWNPLEAGFEVELAVLENGLQADARICSDLKAMLEACRAVGLDPVICSAYRGLDLQQRLYRNKVSRLQAAGYSQEAACTEAARWVAMPGTSEHQTGLALDIVARSYQLLDEKQAETAEQKWLMEHCHEYGFILRYPEEKCAVTGIGYEPWHYRYVGKEAAAAMYESGLCLEEYLKKTDEQKEAAQLPLSGFYQSNHYKKHLD